MSLTPSERKLRASAAAHQSWGNTENRASRTAPARAALAAKFLAEADGDPVRAESLRVAHFQRLALKSALARRKYAGERRAREATEALAALEAEEAAQGGADA